jgi:hypothetical protein
MIDAQKVSRTIKGLLDHLIRGDYATVENLTKGQRLSADEIERAIAGYGRRLVPPPPHTPPRSVVEIEESYPTRWSVYVDLWTSEEGRSDLSLELTLTDSGRNTYDIQIDNIHVL